MAGIPQNYVELTPESLPAHILACADGFAQNGISIITYRCRSFRNEPGSQRPAIK